MDSIILSTYKENAFFMQSFTGSGTVSLPIFHCRANVKMLNVSWNCSVRSRIWSAHFITRRKIQTNSLVNGVYENVILCRFGRMWTLSTASLSPPPLLLFVYTNPTNQWADTHEYTCTHPHYTEHIKHGWLHRDISLAWPTTATCVLSVCLPGCSLFVHRSHLPFISVYTVHTTVPIELG